MQNRNSEVHTLTINVWLQSAKGVHFESALTTINDENEIRGEEACHKHTSTQGHHAIKESFNHLLFLIVTKFVYNYNTEDK